MTDPVIELLADNVQPKPRRQTWHGGPTPVGAVRNVSADDAAWRPARGRHSIWELALHIAYWNYAVRRRIVGGSGERFPRSPANWPALPAVRSEAAWDADRELLRREHDRLVQAIRDVPRARLDTRPAGAKKWTYGELMTGIAQHDAYHTGQIQLLKRLRRGVGALAVATLLLAGCVGGPSSWPSLVTARPAQDVPERFVPEDRSLLLVPADTIAGSGCRSPMADPRDGTRLVMLRSVEDYADYEVPAGRYGVRENEVLRLACNTGRVAGIVRR